VYFSFPLRFNTTGKPKAFAGIDKNKKEEHHRNMKRIQIIFGAGFTSKGEVITNDERERAIACIARNVLANFDGYTLTQHYGGWLEPGSNKLVQEIGYTLTIFAPTVEEQTLRGIAEMIRLQLRQSEVLATVDENFAFRRIS
jgi:hypothetical protein